MGNQEGGGGFHPDNLRIRRDDELTPAERDARARGDMSLLSEERRKIAQNYLDKGA